MDIVRDAWRNAVRAFGARPAQARGVLAIVSNGADRATVEVTAQRCGWALAEDGSNVPPVVLYDRAVSPTGWREAVAAWTEHSPRPYVILVSARTDNNLWDELQRAGGSDILRSPLNPEHLSSALSRAWAIWQGQQRLRS